MTSHAHQFSALEWPFDVPIESKCYSTKRVMDGGYPVLLVTHDADGDWQVLCGTTNDPYDGVVACLGCAFDHDRTIAEVADLAAGWRAWRESTESPWHREPMDEEDDDEG